jgi:ubiquinone/menaquinone biosynthesis C-methylase UbiE
VVFDRTFDFVITAFLFDNFSSATAASVFQQIDSVLRHGGRWLFSDFEVSSHTPWWQKMLLATMYLFFKLICNIETNRLPDTSSLFKKYQYKVASSRVFFYSFIRSTIYIKR